MTLPTASSRRLASADLQSADARPDRLAKRDGLPQAEGFRQADGLPQAEAARGQSPLQLQIRVVSLMRRPLKLCARPLRLCARRLKLYARRPHEFRTRRPPILMRLASNAVGRGSYRKAPANRVSRQPSANARSNRPPHPLSVQSHRERSTWTWVSRPARQPRLESSSFAAVRLGCAASLEPVARLGRSAPLGCASFDDRRAS